MPTRTPTTSSRHRTGCMPARPSSVTAWASPLRTYVTMTPSSSRNTNTLRHKSSHMAKKELQVAAIKNGTVIDHIPADRTYQVVKLLNLHSLDVQVTIGYNLPSS